MCNSVIFLKPLTRLCKYYHVTPEHFHHPQKITSVTSLFPLLPAPGHNRSPFLFMFAVSYKWNRINIYDAFVWPLLASPVPSKALPWPVTCIETWLTSMVKYVQCMDIYSILLIYSSVRQHLACFCTLVIVDNAAVSVGVQVSFQL